MNTGSASVNEMAVTIGGNIRKWRKRNCVTQMDLARQVGLSQSYFSKLEHGRKTPNLSALARLSSVTQIPLDDLIRGS